MKKFDVSLPDEVFQDSCKQLEYNMEWMENEGVELGADDQEAMVEAFGFENMARVRRFCSDWDVAKKKLKSQLPQAFESMPSEMRPQVQKAIVELLTTIKQQNAEFLRLCIDKYAERINARNESRAA